MQTKLAKLKQIILEHQFACFIALCIVIAMVMTLISLEIYKKSGAIKLDMSRPGYEKVRTEVEKSDDNRPYDSSGKLDESAIKDFATRIDKLQQELDNLGNYDESTIDDHNLNLVETEKLVE